MTKRAAALSDRLEVLNRINLRLSADNALLQEQIEKLEGELRSPVRHYATRLVNDLVWGGPRAKAAFVSDVVGQTVRRVLPPAQHPLHRALSQPGGLRAICDQIFPSGQEATIDGLLQHSAGPKIALSLAGGVGDGLWLTAVATAVRTKYADAEIYVFSPNALFRQVYAGNGCVKGVLTVHEPQWGARLPWLLETLLRDGRLDLWYECKYVTKVHYGQHARVEPGEQERTDAAFAEHRLNFHDEFPLGNNLVSAHCASQGLNLFDLVGRSALLDLRDPQLSVVPSMENLHLAELCRHLGEYVTIHHGCDTRIAGSEARLQTKNWSQERWEAVIASLTACTGIKVVQIGTANEAPLRGAIHSFLGRTTVNEAGILIKNARLHLDTEGGMVHLARAVHTPSLVLFGPTALGFFAYPGNVNLREGSCHECWWSTRDWYLRCPRGLATPACMDAIRTETVIRAVTELLAEEPPQARQDLRDFTLFAPDLIHRRREVLEEIYRAAALTLKDSAGDGKNDDTGAYIHGSKNWEYLYAVDQIGALAAGGPVRVLDVGAGRGALSLYLAAAGHQAEICDLDFAAHSHTGRAYEGAFLQAASDRGVRFRFGTIFNLPYESDSFDVVCCISVIEHLRFKEVALSELLRVLRPGGLLVLTFDLLGEGAAATQATADGNRVEIFTEAGIADLLAHFGMEYRRRPQEVAASCEQMARFGIAGIPSGLTVGGLCMVKREPEHRRRRWRSREDRYRVLGEDLTMSDCAMSFALGAIAKELDADCYQVERIPFAPGDVVIDIGAHVGGFSTYLGKKHPEIRIVAFEPLLDNYERCVENLRRNGVTNVTVYNKAVTGDGRRVEIVSSLDNTGGATILPPPAGVPRRRACRNSVESATLEQILDQHAPSGCKLLKMDCEGAEYEVLGDGEALARVEYLSAEFHDSPRLLAQGRSIAGLTALCLRFIPPERLVVQPNQVA